VNDDLRTGSTSDKSLASDQADGRRSSGVGKNLSSVGEHRKLINVSLSKELITLLSEQLYRSPIKAIEELVVNSFDADAPECHVMIPIVGAGTAVGELPIIAVYDNGVGMDIVGLTDLWRVGASTKRGDVIIALRKRTQIGKFGIGKLATYALANRITYITCAGHSEILAVSLSYDEFKSDPTGPERPVQLEVRSISREQALGIPLVVKALEACGLNVENSLNSGKSWTLVLLEELKEAAATELKPGRLRWVLRTAMPLAADFKLFLNAQRIISSKEAYETVADFTVADLPESRIQAISRKTKLDWRVETRPIPSHRRNDSEEGEGDSGGEVREQRALVCDLFEEGISGRVIVTRKTLYGGKSEDLTRSHGFFVRVRGRLVLEDDPLFGLYPQTYQVFNRFRADIDADDLDGDLTAPRESVGLSNRKAVIDDVLLELFYEARVRWNKWNEDQAKPEENKREEDRNYVDPRNVERPVADALQLEDEIDPGTGDDADEEWFYLEVPNLDEIDEVVSRLYDSQVRQPYEYVLEGLGKTGRMVKYVPAEQKFILNEDHELVVAFQDDPRAMDLLYDLVTAEALLEVYLRESGLPPHLVGEILERRDTLLRSLARDQVNSVKAIAGALRNAVASERDLEVALVIAARALGFVAKHMSGAKNPDGLARLRDYPQGERKITLEAKSSAKVPSLGAIDFAGLAEHVQAQGAQGCLLVAPNYPGETRGTSSAASTRARELKISCWTVEQLAQVVESMESHYITARQVLEIVLSAFTPQEVTERLEMLLESPEHAPRDLLRGIVAALRQLETYGPPDMVRSVDMLMPELKRAGITVAAAEVRAALPALAAASRGAMTMTAANRFNLNTSVEELERRVSSLTGGVASSRRGSTFRAEPMRPDSS
jgi:hypothetical protein